MELRKDYILDRWVIIATNRSKRPEQFKSEDDIYANDVGPEKCFFCPGNEENTPDEVGRIKGEKGWDMRWFTNKFPAVDRKGDPEIRTADRFFTYADAYGDHEVIIETKDHFKQIGDLSEEELFMLLKTYAGRIDQLMHKPGTKYVDVFKNQGRKAGTSIIHSHSQIISLNIIPTSVQRKLEAIKRYPSCPYCDILEIEKKGVRLIKESEACISFAPYASRFNFEAWIFPKQHYLTLMDFSDDEVKDLAGQLKMLFLKLKELNANFNMAVFYSPKGEDMHFHICIYPRIALWAGFELETGVTINVVSPEDAAKFYRGED